LPKSFAQLTVSRVAVLSLAIFEEDALFRLLDVIEYYRHNSNFANARTVRNVIDQVILNQNLRTDGENCEDNTIVLSDVEDYIADEKIDLNDTSNGTRKIGFI
jgi:hypothetical protein